MKSLIYKYVLELTEVQTVTLPAKAEILSVQDQGGSICLWAKFAAGIDRYEEITIVIAGTGSSFDDSGLTYLATVQKDAFVWHVFKR